LAEIEADALNLRLCRHDGCELLRYVDAVEQELRYLQVRTERDDSALPRLETELFSWIGWLSGSHPGRPVEHSVHMTAEPFEVSDLSREVGSFVEGAEEEFRMRPVKTVLKGCAMEGPTVERSIGSNVSVATRQSELVEVELGCAGADSESAERKK
jgi:hypothetical protein